MGLVLSELSLCTRCHLFIRLQANHGGLLRFWFVHNRHTEDQRLSIAFVFAYASEIHIYTELFYQKGGVDNCLHADLRD